MHLPTAEEWEEALHPRAVEPAPEHVVTTDVDPGTKMGATEWPGQGLRVAPAEEQDAAWPPKVGGCLACTFSCKIGGWLALAAMIPLSTHCPSAAYSFPQMTAASSNEEQP